VLRKGARRDIINGEFVIRRRAGSLSPSPSGLRADVSGLRAMSLAAGTNRGLLATWRDDHHPRDP
jgi:hypothetical protein